MMTLQGSEKVKIILLDLLDINFKCCYIIYVNKKTNKKQIMYTILNKTKKSITFQLTYKCIEGKDAIVKQRVTNTTNIQWAFLTQPDADIQKEIIDHCAFLFNEEQMKEVMVAYNANVRHLENFKNGMYSVK